MSSDNEPDKQLSIGFTNTDLNDFIFVLGCILFFALALIVLKILFNIFYHCFCKTNLL